MTTNGHAYAQAIYHATHARLTRLAEPAHVDANAAQLAQVSARDVVEPWHGHGEEARPRGVRGGKR
ncbi:hypothetical protein [Burkholderia plantarii]|uniref:hypothetical protein n=1 Tax=Burkholderia plantarii TaxID=41899 RepID=UPI000A9F517A|nr:hypothetical protein [Burkholderia plantarii]GLZ22476.1 hypothetical protein Bpla01_60050 [Burkholderia plantarii]